MDDGYIRYLFLQEINPDEIPHSVTVVRAKSPCNTHILKASTDYRLNQICNRCIPGHYFDPRQQKTVLPAGIIRKYYVDPGSPWNDFVHLTKGFLLRSYTLPLIVFHFAEGQLIQNLNSTPYVYLLRCTFILPDKGLDYGRKCRLNLYFLVHFQVKAFITSGYLLIR